MTLGLECGAIVALGTIAGLWLGWWGAPAVANLVLERSPDQPGIALAVTGRVFAVLTLLSYLCAVLCGVLPALSATRWSLVTTLRHAATPTPGESRMRRAFVVGEVALACVLVASMSLLGRASSPCSM